jgi:hypothetical protein
VFPDTKKPESVLFAIAILCFSNMIKPISSEANVTQQVMPTCAAVLTQSPICLLLHV